MKKTEKKYYAALNDSKQVVIENVDIINKVKTNFILQYGLEPTTEQLISLVLKEKQKLSNS